MVKGLAAFRNWGAELLASQGDMWSERGNSSYTPCDPRAGLKPIHTPCRGSAPNSPEHRRGLRGLCQGWENTHSQVRWPGSQTCPG